MELIELRLEGPYHLRSWEGAAAFDPTSKRGIFLWTIRSGDQYRIAWVGQARDVHRGMWREVVSLLGGGRAIYPPAALAAAERVPAPVYSGKRKDLQVYLNDREPLSALAQQNLTTYDFFWARVAGKRKVREAVESAIITHTQALGGPIQNTKPSRANDKTERTIIRPILPAGVRIEGLDEEIRYGVRLLPQDRPGQVRPEDYQG